jgi:hypothetical protein
VRSHVCPPTALVVPIMPPTNQWISLSPQLVSMCIVPFSWPSSCLLQPRDEEYQKILISETFRNASIMDGSTVPRCRTANGDHNLTLGGPADAASAPSLPVSTRLRVEKIQMGAHIHLTYKRWIHGIHKIRQTAVLIMVDSVACKMAVRGDGPGSFLSGMI